jgi:hypothetical protein
MPQVKVSAEDLSSLEAAAQRLKSDIASDPLTGAMLGTNGNAMAAGTQSAAAPGKKGPAEHAKGPRPQ